MKAVTCRSVCLEIEEADLGSQPGELVREHLRGCASCLKFFEERTKLRELMGSLGTVTAPADFDFQLKARLAKDRSRAPQLFSNFSLGWSSAAVAALVIMAGAFFLFRGMNTRPVVTQTGVVSQTPPIESKSTTGTAPTTASKGPSENTKPADDIKPDGQIRRNVPKSNDRPKQLIAVNNEGASKDFSSLPAPVVKRDEQVANAGPAFPIDVSADSMKLSLDDGSGVSRTITLPRLSFGSERVIGNDQLPRIKTSAKGVW